MKRIFRRAIPVLLVVVMCLSMAAPAYAVEGNVVGVMSNSFPDQHRYSYNSGYTGLIQRFLYIYSSETREKIVNSGGIDGVFGTGTRAAVGIFQGDQGFSQDYVFGGQSWPWLANKMYYSYTTENGYWHYYYNSRILLSIVGGGGQGFYVTEGTQWWYYHREELSNEYIDEDSAFTKFRTEGQT